MPKKKVVKDYSTLLTNSLLRMKKDAKEAMRKLNTMHNENLMAQVRNNTINEYPRIINLSENSGPRGTRNNHHLMQRAKQIEKLEKLNFV